MTLLEAGIFLLLGAGQIVNVCLAGRRDKEIADLTEDVRHLHGRDHMPRTRRGNLQ